MVYQKRINCNEDIYSRPFCMIIQGIGLSMLIALSLRVVVNFLRKLLDNVEKKGGKT